MPMPPDFPETAPTMTVAELAAHYGCSERVVRRWSRESGVDYKFRFQRIPPPDDFREVGPLHTQNELRIIYRRSGSVIARWALATGVTLKRVKRDPAEEIALCLTCPFSKCYGASCPRIGRA